MATFLNNGSNQSNRVKDIQSGNSIDSAKTLVS